MIQIPYRTINETYRNRAAMGQFTSLSDYLAHWRGADRTRGAVATAIEAMASASTVLRRRIARRPFALGACASGGRNNDGDVQTDLDVIANDAVVAAMREAPVAAVASEELDAPIDFANASPVAMAIDPLDGSSNIGANVAIGTIFSILPVHRDGVRPTFLQPGRAQLAAGYVIYGPQCALVMSLGEGTAIFTFDAEREEFYLTNSSVAIPADSNEYAINASNHRHWGLAIRAYIDDRVAGPEGPRGGDSNMRWIASLVAECHRILDRGGVFLYPRDARHGYENGRLRLLYEANPIAFLVEQAGGKASDGHQPILDLAPRDIHQRTPLIFGSAQEIDRIARYMTRDHASFERSPLFGRRGLLTT